jgi:hypothetical protein
MLRTDADHRIPSWELCTKAGVREGVLGCARSASCKAWSAGSGKAVNIFGIFADVFRMDTIQKLPLFEDPIRLLWASVGSPCLCPQDHASRTV